MMKHNEENKELFYRAILTLRTIEECKNFFDDAFTIQETEAIAQRFKVACCLCDGKSYIDTNAATSASTATICRVSKCLNYGSGGYKIAIERSTKEKNGD